MIAVCRNMTSSSRILTEVVAYDVLRQRNRDPELQIARLDACSRGACGDVRNVDYVCVVDDAASDDFAGDFSNPKIHYIKS